MEEFTILEGFPDYAVSREGEIININFNRTLSPSVNQQGQWHVGLVREGRQYRRGVALLVAQTYLEIPNYHWDTPTPIHLNGDRGDCRAINLAWRPRWFAIEYHKQFERMEEHQGLVRCIDTDEVDTTEAFVTGYGLLAREIFRTTWDDYSPGVFPYRYRFEKVK